ncbi:MAG: succinate dehydrogenase/fumarate reductase iron-sulfur subunit [Thermodesulfobacteriota bacterium]|jgi:succinate dehydrogenase / fumarate reductase iron-sulfur subunit
MKPNLLTLRIQRFNKEKDPSGWIEPFEVEVRKGMNLLEALLRIQDEQDRGLAFRYSCRGAVCGSCAMRVNGKDVLACRTHVEDLLEKPALIEPLPLFPVTRDLIVDMSAFFDRYRKMEPYLQAKPISPQVEYPMEEEKRKEIDPYINCILCGICFGTCPAFEKDSEFLGPAMLAKAYRFLVDPRDRRNEEILRAVNHQQGVWGCKTVFNCVKVCPKQVPPTYAIVKMRNRVLWYRIRHLISPSQPFGRFFS